MIVSRRRVYHWNQSVSECYHFHSTFGWMHVPNEIGDDWEVGSFDYYELRHDMDRNKFGLYGSHIIG